MYPYSVAERSEAVPEKSRIVEAISQSVFRTEYFVCTTVVRTVKTPGDLVPTQANPYNLTLVYLASAIY